MGMTNQLTPQQLLEIARVVEPEKVWRIESYGVVGVSDKSPAVLYQPFEEIDRGQAQLLKVIFATFKELYKGGEFDFMLEKIQLNEFLMGQNIDGLLGLAHKVLCK